ncbi:hippocampus abundant transcript 1 protein-like [Pseudophryne corroboree]|uniref:hippocampus abundant transcript 1 protein-like n=1 Tax=Pseudophryne corroboree TaxID=495146 RepID=UPI003081CE99
MLVVLNAIGDCGTYKSHIHLQGWEVGIGGGGWGQQVEVLPRVLRNLALAPHGAQVSSLRPLPPGTRTAAPRVTPRPSESVRVPVTRIREGWGRAQSLLLLLERRWRPRLPVCECIGGQVQLDRGWSLDPSGDERRPGEGTGAHQPEPASGAAPQPNHPDRAASRAQCVSYHRAASTEDCPARTVPIYPALLTPISLEAAGIEPPFLLRPVPGYPVSPLPVHLLPEHPSKAVLVATIDLTSCPGLQAGCCETALDTADPAAEGTLIVTRASVVTAAATGQDDDGAGKMSQEKRKKPSSRVMLVKRILRKDGSPQQGMGKPSVYHAVVVIFLEFFAWGLLTTPMLVVLHETFPQHTFLMNGLIQGVKGFLSFMCAPLIGGLSDVYGRKSFLLITVFFTCAPIPLMRISPWWYFAMISVSGAFSVTFSVIFAYVADITQEHERSTAYGLVSATFAASLVTSPAIGAYISTYYGDNFVVLLATVVALLDICFIWLVVPESLREKMRPTFWGAPFSWEQADPFASLKKIGKDTTVLLICITVFFSYLPEAGQYSSFFLYLKQIIGFTQGSIAAFIAVVGILSILAQTLFLGILMRSIGNKNTVLLGLGFQMFQLAWYGFGSQPWMIWAAGAVAAMSSITFPAVSALISRNAELDQQGVAQGMVTGIRGLCNGLGPALYGFVFFMFHVELGGLVPVPSSEDKTPSKDPTDEGAVIPGPPFLFGAVAVLLAFMVALFIPEHSSHSIKTIGGGKHSNSSNPQTNNSDHGGDEDIEPLLQDTSV